MGGMGVSINYEFVRILLTNVQKCLEKILFTHQTESSFLSEILFDSLRHTKSIFSTHFCLLVNKKRFFFGV